LEFGDAVKVLEEHIEILKQNPLFLMAERKKSERSMMMMPTQEIITIKRELDKAVQERMKLSQIYCSHNSSVAVSAAIVYYFSALSSEYESAAAAIARVSTNAAIISVSITFHLSTPNIVTTTCL
jgi:hypothetical protein